MEKGRVCIFIYTQPFDLLGDNCTPRRSYLLSTDSLGQSREKLWGKIIPALSSPPPPFKKKTLRFLKVDRTGFEPASATFAGCYVPVTPPAQSFL